MENDGRPATNIGSSVWLKTMTMYTHKHWEFQQETWRNFAYPILQTNLLKIGVSVFSLGNRKEIGSVWRVRFMDNNFEYQCNHKSLPILSNFSLQPSVQFWGSIIPRNKGDFARNMGAGCTPTHPLNNFHCLRQDNSVFFFQVQLLSEHARSLAQNWCWFGDMARHKIHSHFNSSIWVKLGFFHKRLRPFLCKKQRLGVLGPKREDETHYYRLSYDFRAIKHGGTIFVGPLFAFICSIPNSAPNSVSTHLGVLKR